MHETPLLTELCTRERELIRKCSFCGTSSVSFYPPAPKLTNPAEIIGKWAPHVQKWAAAVNWQDHIQHIYGPYSTDHKVLAVLYSSFTVALNSEKGILGINVDV